MADFAPPAGTPQDDFFEAIFLLRCMNEMQMDCDALLAAADLAWKKNGQTKHTPRQNIEEPEHA